MRMQLNDRQVISRLASACLFLMLLICPRVVVAGTDAGLAFEPWGDRQHLTLNATTLFEQAGPTDAGDVGINLYQGDFRLRPNPKDPYNFAIGADITDINIQGNVPSLGPRLVDQSYAIGFQLPHLSDALDLGVVAGVGYSGSTPFIQGDSFYAKGSLIFDHRFNKQDSLAMVVDYNGNRTFLPDGPIPTIVYQHIEGEKLSWVLGLPVAAIHWMPTDRWTIDLSYTPIVSINASAEYEFVKDWKLYASFESVENAFHRDGAPPNRRIFFEQRRTEAGIKWIPLPMVRLSAAGGFAFGQKFVTGWDLRSTSTLLKLHDEPYFRLKATLYF